MSLIINPRTFDILFFFGICSSRYSHITRTVHYSFFRFLYSCVYFLTTSVSLDCILVMTISSKILHTQDTHGVVKIIENIVRSIIHNFCMMDLFLRRKSYVDFLNSLDNFQKVFDSELDCRINSKSKYCRSLTITLSVVAYMTFISILFYLLNSSYITDSIIFWFVAACLKDASFMLVGVDICNLSMILLNRYEHVFEVIGSLVKETNNEATTTKNMRSSLKSLFKCLEKLEELEELKLKFSHLFGVRILLIVSYNFVVISSAFYFLFFSTIFRENQDLFELIPFAMYYWPSFAILCWMVVSMDKLGQQVSSFITCL